MIVSNALLKSVSTVPHSSMQFALKQHHAPPQFCQVLQALYSRPSAKVITTDWTTPLMPLQIGVYQGDPLSVVIFNQRLLVDTLQTHLDLGHTIQPPGQVHPTLQPSASICSRLQTSQVSRNVHETHALVDHLTPPRMDTQISCNFDRHFSCACNSMSSVNQSKAWFVFTSQEL